MGPSPWHRVWPHSLAALTIAKTSDARPLLGIAMPSHMCDPKTCTPFSPLRPSLHSVAINYVGVWIDRYMAAWSSGMILA